MPSLVKPSLSLAVALTGAAAIVGATPSTAAYRAGPFWISIEYPANPLDPSTRGAYLLVHAFHHQLPISSPVSGTAEGLVGGERKSIVLRFDSTTRPGVYALRKQWSDDGVWSLVLSVVAHDDNMAQALVELGPDGVTSIRVPTRREREWRIPRVITAQEVEQSLQSRTPRTAQARR